MKKKTLLPLLLLLILLSAGKSYGQLFWNHAAAFSGNANSYIVMPHSNSLGMVGDFSLEAWVNPSAVNGPRTFIAKNSGSFGLAINNGRAAIFTNNNFRLQSKQTSLIPINKWTHIAGTYNFSANKFELYINGTLDTSAVVTAAFPPAGNDSMYIGKNGTAYYQGMLDDIRLWSKTLTAGEVKRNMRTSLSINNTDNSYTGLCLSLTFQDDNASGNIFSLYDKSTRGNHSFNRGALQVNLTNKLSTTISYNEAMQFDGNGDYLEAGHTSYQVVSSGFTLEAWVYIKQFSGANQIIMKKRDASAGYELSVNAQNQLTAAVNNIVYNTNYDFPSGRWVHVAFAMAQNGTGKIYADGTEIGSSAFALVQPNNLDLYVGGSPADGQWLNGYIDEIRISKYTKTHLQIREFMYKSMDLSNDPSSATQDNIFNFDGSTHSNSHGIAGFEMKGDARFSNPNTVDGTPISPMLRNEALNFSTGYNIKTTDRRIPETGTLGLMKTDSLYIPSSSLISDVNLFVAINHTYDADLEITLIAPNGDSANICFDHTLNAGRTGDIITIFDSNTDSAITNGLFTAYAPAIRPDADITSPFLAENPQGYWKLKINDDASGDTGRVYAWGIQFNNNILVGVPEVSNTAPLKYELSQNYPNPFNPATSIKFSLPQTGMVKLNVYDMLGKQVATLINQVKPAGTYNAYFDGSALSSGAYFYRLETEGFTDTKKMLLIK